MVPPAGMMVLMVYSKASLVQKVPLTPALHPSVPSSRQAFVTVPAPAQAPAPGPRVAKSAYPAFGYVVEYVTSVVLMVRVVLAAAALLAEMRDRIRFGMAMAAMIRMIATTISSSISEKPFCLRIEISSKIPLLRLST